MPAASYPGPAPILLSLAREHKASPPHISTNGTRLSEYSLTMGSPHRRGDARVAADQGDPMDDAHLDRLAAAYRAGDPTSLKPVVEALARPLLAQAYRYVRDWDTAADLVQDAWLKVVANIAAYDPARSFAVWIRAILRNTCLTHLRKVARMPAQTAVEAAGGAATARPADDPRAAMQEQDTARRLGLALAQLGPTQREVFARIALEQEDRRAVARDLGLSDGHLRVTLHMARRRLAVLLNLEEEPS